MLIKITGIDENDMFYWDRDRFIGKFAVTDHPNANKKYLVKDNGCGSSSGSVLFLKPGVMYSDEITFWSFRFEVWG